jgi:hypothetical protein
MRFKDSEGLRFGVEKHPVAIHGTGHETERRTAATSIQEHQGAKKKSGRPPDFEYKMGLDFGLVFVSTKVLANEPSRPHITGRVHTLAPNPVESLSSVLMAEATNAIESPHKQQS